MDFRRSPGQRAGLTRDAVLAEARAVMADDGVQGLTMRALAERLGVRPNALYSHVTSKAELLDAVLDDVLGEVATPAGDGSPRHEVRRLMASVHDVVREHPDLVPHYLAKRGLRGPNGRQLRAATEQLLARAGLPPDKASEARRVLAVYSIGFAAFSETPPSGPVGDGAPPMRDSFATGLEWLLAGILGE
ncbi:TetR/AcrR family transcriptional regulator [Parafrankia sp. EUN1f]|uniref:TetR/AcrR family transcriptional regulator n=1 Tax=Parafrankia sp. EUN1f TaxID=102897 RepID=UPI0001C43DE4|nr:TetR/AcrR family transcriptional regulator [Parafrankia sp. EUN1f]EFC85746.1 transcriptional regulator, TetR family [Parafrankia sp. EUN1f]